MIGGQRQAGWQSAMFNTLGFFLTFSLSIERRLCLGMGLCVLFSFYFLVVLLIRVQLFSGDLSSFIFRPRWFSLFRNSVLDAGKTEAGREKDK